MKIRSITCFIDPGSPPYEKQLQAAGGFVAAARPAFEAAGFEVQSARLATPPFPILVHRASSDTLVDLAQSLEAKAGQWGFDYVSLGPALPDDLVGYAQIPDALAATQNCFFSGSMTTLGGGVSLAAVRLCAEVITRAAPISPDGFANLRFAAL